MHRASHLVAAVALVTAVSGCSQGLSAPWGGSGPSAPGGDGTVRITGAGAFSQPAANLTQAEVARFRIGDRFFTEPWSVPGEGRSAQDGLGPTFLASSCASCHPADGRSAPPGAGDAAPILRFVDADGAGVALDDYGVQLQTASVDGVEAEGTIEVTWNETQQAYPDGTPYTLRTPEVRVTDEAFGSLAGRHASGFRTGPGLIGLGLLEAIDPADIRANTDPDDADGDGISGRASVVASLSGVEMLGRFGLKANIATIADQTALAYLLDLGITSPRYPEENCPDPQVACVRAATGGSPEISAERLAAVVFYGQTLAVPARTGTDDESVVEGRDLFNTIGCDACHIERWVTASHEVEALANQTIYPFTDLLLHDMGPELGDGRTDGVAGPTEWRTAPLWGLGMVRAVNPEAGFLHDGRARSIEEAVLWHGGEGAASRDRFVALDADDRRVLLHFLKSL